MGQPTDRHKADNVMIGIRARRDWITRLDEAAESAGESRMAYVRRAVEERMGTGRAPNHRGVEDALSSL